MTNNKWWLSGLLVLGLAATACSIGQEASSEFTEIGVDAAPADSRGLADGDDAAGESEGGEPATEDPLTDAAIDDRKVIRTGQITVQADDTRAVMDEITTLVDEAGGYVASSQVNPTGEDRQPSITITIRVPADGLNSALSAIRGMADEVLSESIQSQDVTEEYVDIESRLRNLTALETGLLALLAEVREQPDADPQKLLTVYDEVSRVRGEIEVLEGRRRLLDNQASLSTLTVSIEPTPISEPIVEEGWQPLVTARQALGDLVEALQSLGDAAIWFAIFALPVLLLVGLPVYVVVRLLRGRSIRSASSIEGPSTPAATASVSTGEADDQQT